MSDPCPDAPCPVETLVIALAHATGLSEDVVRLAHGIRGPE